MIPPQFLIKLLSQYLLQLVWLFVELNLTLGRDSNVIDGAELTLAYQ